MEAPPTSDIERCSSRSRIMNDEIRGRGWPWVIGQGVLLLLLAWGAFWWRPLDLPSTLDFVATMVGLLLLTAGVAYALIALTQLRRNLTPLPEPRPAANLITSGIYGRTRHPVYGGVIVATVGLALVVHTVPALVIAGFIPLFLLAKSRHEEQRLRRRFPDYDRYAAHTHRFLP